MQWAGAASARGRRAPQAGQASRRRVAARRGAARRLGPHRRVHAQRDDGVQQVRRRAQEADGGEDGQRGIPGAQRAAQRPGGAARHAARAGGAGEAVERADEAGQPGVPPRQLAPGGRIELVLHAQRVGPGQRGQPLEELHKGAAQRLGVGGRARAGAPPGGRAAWPAVARCRHRRAHRQQLQGGQARQVRRRGGEPATRKGVGHHRQQAHAGEAPRRSALPLSLRASTAAPPPAHGTRPRARTAHKRCLPPDCNTEHAERNNPVSCNDCSGGKRMTT